MARLSSHHHHQGAPNFPQISSGSRPVPGTYRTSFPLLASPHLPQPSRPCTGIVIGLERVLPLQSLLYPIVTPAVPRSVAVGTKGYKAEMAAPYAYQPFMVQTPYLWPYIQQQNHTPFIPPQQQLPPSPRAGAGTRRVHFEDEDVYGTGRPRPPSWHAGMAGTSPAPNPAPFPSPPIYVTPLPTVVPLPGHPMAAPVSPPTHHRRYSDGVLPQPAWVTMPTWLMYPPAQPPQLAAQLNPLLNGENGNKPPIIFDLSFYAFEPRRATSGHPAGKSLSQEEYSQTATYPGVTRMVITCDEIPGLQVVLEPLRERASNSGYLSVPPVDTTPVPPITVYDVLFAIHRKLQTQIRHRDWVALPQSKADAIARAYTRRCRTFPTVQQFEESQGVKWVDFLENKYMFKGLARHRAEPGFEHLRLLVAKP